VNALLSPLSWLMRCAVTVRNRGFDLGILKSTTVGVPVISVGNLVVGGTGKTPLAHHIAALLSREGKRVAVVSRGYRRNTRGVVVVSNGRGDIVDPAIGGDEAVQIARRLPRALVVVGERRVAAAREAIQLGAETIVLDDAYQHRYISRDLNVLVVDGTRDLRREHLLPVGTLREPISGIRRADVIAVSHVRNPSDAAWLNGLAGDVVICFEYVPGTLRRADDDAPASVIPEGPVLAFSGIGRHERFAETLKKSGLEVAAEVAFPDHHEYSENDLTSLMTMKRTRNLLVCVTTEKDAVRLSGSGGIRSRFLVEANVHYLPIDIAILYGEETFRSVLLRSLQHSSTSSTLQH